ncbi:hypothetical protein Pmani_000019 [Petrolisthes manimaculis]|uniref:Uncharacterized protein n=1 Tax=Petrolisthes manimaculis TaxID=1843537 RepID=A0AAE1UQQ9_9EUCA|nr:hypothetical protein Pmani_000019 [Petrolisthes manimaculis]
MGEEQTTLKQRTLLLPRAGQRGVSATYPTANSTWGNTRHRSCYYCVLAPSPITSSMSSYPATLCLGIGGPESTDIVTLVMYGDGEVGYWCWSITV